MALAKNIGAGQAGRYYDKDDYYTKDAAAPSGWHGKGAEALGLSGAMRPEDFQALVRGELPDGTRLHHGGGDRRAGTDFEFSAPKSFSIQALVAGDDRLVQVHQKAVAVARERIEATTATRVTEHGRTRVEVTGKAVMAEFLHTTSRAGDPDLHSHVVALNLTQRQDGQWRSVDNTAMFKEQRLMYEIYLSELAKGARDLGYEITTGKHGNPELAQISCEQIEQFSSRGRDIEAALAAKGLTLDTATPKQKKAATLATRNAKQDYDRAALTREWQARAKAAGMDTSLPRASARGQQHRGGPQRQESEHLAEQRSAREAVKFALAHLGEREAAFERRDVLTVALRESRGDVGYGAVAAELARRERAGQVLPSRDAQQVTTLKALDIERRILAGERFGRERVTPIASHSEVARHLAGRDLTVGQAQAVEVAATTHNRIAGIQGYAGSGKTTALHTFGELAQERGYQVIGLAPSHSAVKALRESGIEAKTLQSWLSDRTAPAALNDRTLLVVDEAGLVGNRNLLSTLERAEKSGARVLLVGDTRQYQSVSAGRAFTQLQQHGMETARMTEILRQRDGQLREAARLSVDQPVRALAKLDVREIPDAAQRYQRIALDYAGLPRTERDGTLILTGTNAARTELNAAVREALKARGELDGPTASVQVFQRKDLTEAEQKRLDRHAVGDAVWFQQDYRSLGVARGELYRIAAVYADHVVARSAAGREIAYTPARLSAKGFQLGRVEAREVAPGERLRVTGTDRELGIRNGERGQVESISGETLVLRTDQGERKVLKADRVLPVEHGYAATGHSAQGLGADRVLLDKDAQAKTTDHRSFYTDLTRARQAAVVYTNDRSALPEAILRQSQKTAALDVAGQRQRAPDMGSGPQRTSSDDASARHTPQPRGPEHTMGRF
ncbi:MAG: MobF family relaxase [Nevskia sp.]|nr:MobF family relaxase [Nevskia sp.]